MMEGTMSIQRWDPLRDIVSLREAMNSLLEESFVRPRAGMAALTGAMPVDLSESDASYTVRTALPGAKADDVDISILGDTLRITAEIHGEKEKEGEKWLLRERRFGHFERTITLPNNIKAEGASADFNDGVLTITLPKSEAARPRQIQVRAGSQQGDTQPQEIEVETHAPDDQQAQEHVHD
jgi:HSP20 family protein